MLERGEPLGVGFVVGRVDNHQTWLLAQQSERASDLLLLLGHVRFTQRLARLHGREHNFQRRVLVLDLLMLETRQRLLERVFNALETIGDDFHIGQHEVFVERAEVGGRVGAGEAGHDEHQAAGLADHRHSGGVAFVRPAEARRIDQFDGRHGDLFGVIDLAELFDPRIRDRRHGALPGMRHGRIGRYARQPMEQSALARSLITDQTDFHAFTLD